MNDVLLSVASFAAGSLITAWVGYHYYWKTTKPSVETNFQTRMSLIAILRSLEKAGLVVLWGQDQFGMPEYAKVGEEIIAIKKPIVMSRKWWNKGPVTKLLERRERRT